MKKPVTEERSFCDFCAGYRREKPAYTQCLVCGKDICIEHRLELEVYLVRQDKGFRASLCPVHARDLAPILNGFREKSDTWQKVGQNPEYNEARLEEIFKFMAQ